MGDALQLVNEIHENNGTGNKKKKRKKAKVHPVLLSLDIDFLAHTSIGVYKEVQKVTTLPDLWYVQCETEEIVSRNVEKPL